MDESNVISESINAARAELSNLELSKRETALNLSYLMRDIRRGIDEFIPKYQEMVNLENKLKSINKDASKQKEIIIRMNEKL